MRPLLFGDELPSPLLGERWNESGDSALIRACRSPSRFWCLDVSLSFELAESPLNWALRLCGRLCGGSSRLPSLLGVGSL